MKIFVVSLKRASERRKAIVLQLNRLKLDFELIDAVDGKLIEETEKKKLVDGKYLDCTKYCFNDGEIGCALSHLNIYKKISDEEIEHALILEDDVLLPDNILDILDELDSEIANDEVLLLSYFSHKHLPLELSSQNLLQMKTTDSKFLYPVDIQHVGSAMAYVVSRQAAQNLTQVNAPMIGTADHWGKFWNNGGFSSLRCIYPSLVKENQFSSTINYESTKSWLFKVASFVRKYRIPLLINLLEKRDKLRTDNKHRVVINSKEIFNAK